MRLMDDRKMRQTHRKKRKLVTKVQGTKAGTKAETETTMGSFLLSPEDPPAPRASRNLSRASIEHQSRGREREAAAGVSSAPPAPIVAPRVESAVEAVPTTAASGSLASASSMTTSASVGACEDIQHVVNSPVNCCLVFLSPNPFVPFVTLPFFLCRTDMCFPCGEGVFFLFWVVEESILGSSDEVTLFRHLHISAFW